MEAIVFPKEVPKVGNLVQIFLEGYRVFETRVTGCTFGNEIYSVSFSDNDYVLLYVKEEWYVLLNTALIELNNSLLLMLCLITPLQKAKILIISE